MQAEEIYKIIGAAVDGLYICPVCNERSLHFVISEGGIVLFTCITGCDYRKVKAALRITSFADDARETRWTKDGTKSIGNEEQGWTIVDPVDQLAYEEREREAKYGYEKDTE